MDTKDILLILVHEAKSGFDDCLIELFELIQSNPEDIDWYILNDMSDIDVLSLIVLSDTSLSMLFNKKVLIAAVNFIFKNSPSHYH